MELPATIGKYELLEFLGGGMSHVYRARDTVIDRAVVVKILTDSGCQDADTKARFLQEAKAAAGLGKADEAQQHCQTLGRIDVVIHDQHAVPGRW